MTIQPPLSLYMHLPWCVRKCPYCDFNSYTAGDAVAKSRYIQALKTDLEREAVRVEGRTLETVFLGGGTPSFFTPDEIGQLIDSVRRHYSLASNAEITMEANPGTVECGEPTGYRDAGINRLSIGAQSFNPEFLSRLGRIHSVDDIERSVSEARDAGFDSINIDIMYALPGQVRDQALSDLQSAIALQPDHLSWYQLTLEPNTVFHARPPADLPDADSAWEIQAAGQAYLNSQGFRQYEVSAWTKAGYACRHNLNYWQFGDYVAVGAGAHGKLTLDGVPMRYERPKNPQAYMAAIESSLPVELKSIPPRDLVFEFALMNCRLNDGFSLQNFEQATGLARAEILGSIDSCLEKKLLEAVGNDQFQPTELGRRFLNDLQGLFLPR